MLIADGGGGARPTVVPTTNTNTTQQPPSTNPGGGTQSDAAARARELQRQIEALLERIREMQRQAAEARRRALEAQQKAEIARKAAEAARAQADKTKLGTDEQAAKKAEQDYKLADARLKKAAADVQVKDKEIALAEAQVAQKKEQKKSPDGNATAETNQKVANAQADLDAAKRTSSLSNDYLDYQEKETKAVDAEAKVLKLTPVAGRPSSTVSQAEWDALTAAKNEATTLRNEANAAKSKFMSAVGSDAPIELYGPGATQSGQTSGGTPLPPSMASDPLHSPLLQFVQVSPWQMSATGNPYRPTQTSVSTSVASTLSGLAEGKTVQDIAEERGITVDEVLAETRAAGIEVETTQPTATTRQTTLKRGDATITYTYDSEKKTLGMKAEFADAKAPGGKRVIETVKDAEGRFIQTVKDDKGKVTVYTIDPAAGTRTETVTHTDGSKVETTTDLTGAPVLRPVKPGENYLDVAKAAGLTPEELLALNPDVDYGKPLKPGQQMVVSGVRTTVRTTYADGSVLEKTTQADGSIRATFKTKDGHVTVLAGDAQPNNNVGERIRKGLFEEGKSVTDMAKATGMTEAQVLEALKAEGVQVQVTAPTSDNGDVETRIIYDPTTNKVVVEHHDWQHDTTQRQVIDDGSKFTVRQFDPDTKQYVMVTVTGGTGYLQKLADQQLQDVHDLDAQIRKIDESLRMYRRMGERTDELVAERERLVARRNIAKGEADVAQGRATSALLKNQQVKIDKIAAQVYQRLLVTRPGSAEQQETQKVLNDLLALADKVDRLTAAADTDVEYLLADLDRKVKHDTKVNADETLQAAFQKWKDEVWMWQGVDADAKASLQKHGLKPHSRMFGSAEEEDKFAWEAFERQQLGWDKYGYSGKTDIEAAARRAWLQRNEAAAAETSSNDQYYQVSIDKGQADAHVIEGDIARLQGKKNEWVQAHPKDFSENFPAVKGQHGGQQELNGLQAQWTQLQVGVRLDTKALEYNKFLMGLSVTDRQNPVKLKEANAEYGEKHGKRVEQLDQEIHDLTMAELRRRSQVSEAYIAQWAKDNPELHAKLKTLETTPQGSGPLLGYHLADQRELLLTSSHEGLQLKSALTMQTDTKGKLLQIAEGDLGRVQKDLDSVSATVEGQTWLRDVFSDVAEDAKDWTQAQRDEFQALRDDLASGKITLTEYTRRQDELMGGVAGQDSDGDGFGDGYAFRSIDLAQELGDSNETWAVVDEAVRMTVSAAAGIATTIATGGNVALGMLAAAGTSALWDTSNDIYSSANGYDLYADGHTSVFTYGWRYATDRENITSEQRAMTFKDEVIDLASAAVTGTGVGAGLKTSTSLTLKMAAKRGITLGPGRTLPMAQRAWVGARAGFSSQAVDGLGRVGVETLHVGLDGKLGTQEGTQRIVGMVKSGAVGLATAPFVGAASAALPFDHTKIFTRHLFAQTAVDFTGSMGTGELIAQWTHGRSMNRGEAVAAAIGAVPGTATNILFHPSRVKPAATQATSGTSTSTKPVQLLGPDGKSLDPTSLQSIPMSAKQGGQPITTWEQAATHADHLIALNRQDVADQQQAQAATPPTTHTPRLQPSSSESALLAWMKSPALPGTVFVVSRLGPADTVFASGGGVRARRRDTYADFASASAAAQAMGGGWINRVQLRTDLPPVKARARVGSDEIVAVTHRDGDGNALPYAIPNTKNWETLQNASGEPTVKGGIKGKLSAEPFYKSINPLQMMGIGIGFRLGAEILRATVGLGQGSSLLGGRAAAVAPGPLSTFGRLAYLASSQRGKEALMAAMAGDKGKAMGLIDKVIKGTGFRGDNVMSDADATKLRANIESIADAGAAVKLHLDRMGDLAPSRNVFSLHALTKSDEAAPALLYSILEPKKGLDGLRGFLKGARNEVGGDYHKLNPKQARDLLLARLDKMTKAQLHDARHNPKDQSVEARFLKQFDEAYRRLDATADDRVALRPLHDTLFDRVFDRVGKDGVIDLGESEALGGSTNSPNTQLGKFSRRAVILTNVNLAVGAGFKSRYVGDGATQFANFSDVFTLGTAVTNIYYNLKVDKLAVVKHEIKLATEAGGFASTKDYLQANPDVAKAETKAQKAKDRWNMIRDYAGLTSAARAFGQTALVLGLDFGDSTLGQVTKYGLAAASAAQGLGTAGWVFMQQYRPAYVKGRKLHFAEHRPFRDGPSAGPVIRTIKWGTAISIALVPAVTQAVLAATEPVGEKKESFFEEQWKKLFPSHEASPYDGHLPGTVPAHHAGDPLRDPGFERVLPEDMPELQPMFATVDGRDARTRSLWGMASDHADVLLGDPALFKLRLGADDEGQAHLALEQLLDRNPQFNRDHDGVVSAEPGDPDTLLDGWQVQVGERWVTT